jgi:mono/diheme cytochrome c family protein
MSSPGIAISGLMTNSRRKLISVLVFAPAALCATALFIASTGGAATSPNTAANRTLFKANCGSCHTLKAAKTHGAVGPPLDIPPQNHDSLSRIIRQITNGGRFMPPQSITQGGKLTGTQIKAIAAYVIAVRAK